MAVCLCHKTLIGGALETAPFFCFPEKESFFGDIVN